MGRSGGGKGTQAELLKTYLESKGAENVLHVTTGGAFREFIKGEGFVSKQAREVNNAGGLQPEFLAIWNWTNIFINSVQENTTVILDGAPRKVIEMNAMHAVIPFLGYSKPIVIYIEVGRAWAKDRLNYRQAQSEEKRADTSSDEEIEKRLSLFDEDIIPCIEKFVEDPRYTYIHVNGEQTVEEVQAELVAKLNLA